MRNINVVLLLMMLGISTSWAQTGIQQGIEIGNKAPEIIENSVSGNPIKLSSLAGKIVLIDFWASWCKPCRNENPFVVSSYEKYKDVSFTGGNGFTIFSVSLDKDPKAWKNAILADGLSWENHVCVLNSNAVYIQSYNISMIPTNFLIDGNGVILARNLRGKALEEKLASLKK